MVRSFEWLAAKAAAFSQWLNSSTVTAKVARYGLQALMISLLALEGILAGFVGVMGAATIALKTFSVIGTGLPLLLGAIFIKVAAITAIIAGLLILIDDIVTSLSGGDAVTRRLGEWLTEFRAIYVTIEAIWWIWDKFVAGYEATKSFLNKLPAYLPPSIGGGVFVNPSFINDLAVDPAKKQAKSISIHQENHLHAAIDGATSPRETGRAVIDTWKEGVAKAAYQMPVPTY